MSVAQIAFDVIVKVFKYFIIPLTKYIFYFMMFCFALTLIGNLAGIFGFFIFVIVFYYYVKGILFIQPPTPTLTPTTTIKNTV
jgi:hypothetical protein